MWQAKQRATQFIANRPKTSLFLGTILFLGSLPITIMTSIVLCISLVLGSAFILLQGTVLAVTFAGIATTLVGPIFIATAVTMVFYAVRRLYLALRCLRVRMLFKTRTVLEQYHVLPKDETNRQEKDPQNNLVQDSSNHTPSRKLDPKNAPYQCKFCRTNRHDLCMSRRRAHDKTLRDAGQQTGQPPTWTWYVY